MIAIIAMLSDLLINLMLVFQPMRSKAKTQLHLVHMFFYHILSKLQELARNSDGFIRLFSPVVIGQSNFFGIGFLTSF